MHRSGRPLRLAIQTGNFTLRKRATKSVRPSFRKVDVVGNAPRRPHIINIAVAKLAGTTNGGIVLSSENEDLARCGSELTPDIDSVADCRGHPKETPKGQK